MKLYWLAGCLALITSFGMAQDVEVVDSARAPERPPQPPAQLVAPQAKPVRVQLPATVRPLRQESSEPQNDRKQVGYLEPFDPNWVPQHQATPLPDGGRVWRYELHSPNAIGLRCQMWGNPAQGRLEVRFYDPVSGYVLPPIVSPRLDDEGFWWGPTIWGDTLGIEIYQPSGANGEFPLAIVGVVYLYCTGDCGTPGNNTDFTCYNDITCFSAWKGSIEDNAVGKYFFVSGSGCFTCTGTMINRQPGDFSPLFITAQHCMDRQSETNSMEIFWEYETAQCNNPATLPNPNTLPRNIGALLLKRYQDADTILVGLYDPPGVGSYVGSSTASPVGESIAGVHHPGDSFKRISFGTVAAADDNVSFTGIPYTVDTWRVSYTSGTTEGGSSGSALYGADRRLRGVLTGGTRACPVVTKYYGRFSDATTNLRYYLFSGDISSPVFVNRAVAGDPENGGNSERGTSANPFNTVYEATFNVRANDTVRIVPGNYNERFRVWRPMRLERSGTSGVVVIGRP
ncbi:MAG: serine protease [Fimbriimonadales bacterium]|nr:serine protease [Fimbriimonadales bacterium]